MILADNVGWQEVRRRVYPPHAYAKQAHCRDCKRKYHREKMRLYRLCKDRFGEGELKALK